MSALEVGSGQAFRDQEIAAADRLLLLGRVGVRRTFVAEISSLCDRSPGRTNIELASHSRYADSNGTITFICEHVFVEVGITRSSA
jgi:hypothetical protein